MSYTIIVGLLYDYSITHYDFVIHITTHSTHYDHASHSNDHNYALHVINDHTY